MDLIDGLKYDYFELEIESINIKDSYGNEK